MAGDLCEKAAGAGPHERGTKPGGALKAWTCRGQAAVGVAVIWVARRERRRGLATAMVDSLRCSAPVAFSQPTELGWSFASSYSRRSYGLDVPFQGRFEALELQFRCRMVCRTRFKVDQPVVYEPA